MLNITLDDAAIVKIISKYGAENQDVILIEEMSELTKELVKRRRGRGYHSCLVEEMSHVLFSLNVMAYILDINSDDLQAEIDNKLFFTGIKKSSENIITATE